MKKLCYYTVLTVMVFTFYGCPTDFKYALGIPGEEKIDNKLIGEWLTTNENSEVLSFIISQRDKYSYNVVVTKKSELYKLESDNYIGWITKFEGKTFLYFKPENEDSYFHYVIIKSDINNMVTNEVYINEFRVNQLKTRALFINEMKKMSKQNEFANDAVSWKKQ